LSPNADYDIYNNLLEEAASGAGDRGTVKPLDEEEDSDSDDDFPVFNGSVTHYY